MEALVKAVTSPRKKLTLDPLDLLLNAEMGDARELLSEQLQSPSARSALRTLYFHKSSTVGEFILSRDDAGSEFVMLARIDDVNKKFDIYQHKMTEPQYVAGVPDAILTWNSKAADKWIASVSLSSLVCDDCAYKRRSIDETSGGPTTKFTCILEISQGMENLPTGQHWFWMDLSAKLTECGERRIIDCQHCHPTENNCRNAPLSPPLSPRSLVKSDLSVRSMAPIVSPRGGNLSVSFISRDRTIQPSARNVQCSSLNSEEVCFQFIKLSSNVFAIDYRAPLSPLQAFCAALSTNFWT